MGKDIFHYIRLLKALSNLTSNFSKDGAPTTPLHSPLQYLTTLILKHAQTLAQGSILRSGKSQLDMSNTQESVQQWVV